MTGSPKPEQPWQSPSLEQLSVSMDTAIGAGSSGDADASDPGTNTKVG